MADLNTLVDHYARRMRAAEMEEFLPTIGEGYGMENALMLVICQDPDVKRSGELSFTNDHPLRQYAQGDKRGCRLRACEWILR